jgi:MFS family permease
MAAKFGIGWRQVAACLVLLGSSAMLAPTYSILAVPLGTEFHPTRMVLMLAMTVFSLISGIISPFLGNLMDRVSLRRTMLVGALALAAGFAAMSFATSFAHILVIYGLFMAPANVLLGPVATSVLVSRWFVKRRGAAIGIAISGVALGSFVFSPLIQGLLDHFDWRDAVRILAAILLVLTIPAALLVVNRPSDKGLHADGADSDPEPVHGHGAAPVLSRKAILSDPTFWLAAIVFAVVLSGMKGMVTNLMPLAVDKGINASVAAYLISIYAGCGFVAKLSFATVADRFSLRALMFVSIIGFAAGMACLLRADLGYPAIATGVGMIGFFGGLMVPLQGLLIPRIYGQAVVGRAAGLMSFVTLCALLATPPIFGLMYDMTGSYNGIFLAFIALSAAIMLVVPYIRLHAKPIPAAQRDKDDDLDAAGAVLAEAQKG